MRIFLVLSGIWLSTLAPWAQASDVDPSIVSFTDSKSFVVEKENPLLHRSELTMKSQALPQPDSKIRDLSLTGPPLASTRARMFSTQSAASDPQAVGYRNRYLMKQMIHTPFANPKSFVIEKENQQLQISELTMKSQSLQQPDSKMWNLSLTAPPQMPKRVQLFSTQSAASSPQAFSFRNGYSIRRKIHKYASIATLPLFAAEVIVGQKLFDENDYESSSLRSTHSALSAGIGVLFGVESVTGAWNMWEARKITHGRWKRLFHGITMLAADAGFVVTAALASHEEEDEEEFENNGNASAHRAAAFASLGVATVSYVYMLIAK